MLKILYPEYYRKYFENDHYLTQIIRKQLQYIDRKVLYIHSICNVVCLHILAM